MAGRENLEALEQAWNDERYDDMRLLFRDLDPEERRLLEAEIGADVYASLERAARRAGSRAKRGRVIVINGIMGARLDVTRNGARDKVWINAWSLIKGRFSDFELAPSGRTQHKPGTSVQIRGLHKSTYIPLVLELDRQWHVKKFPFDWRLDIGTSAERLAEVVAEWGRGEPVHIVAHSMGGLVARLFAQRHSRVWRSMRDESRLASGGRLLMLGTPNRGSFEIPQVLTGQNGNVKKLAFLDQRHGRAGTVKIIASFPGCYQMLPSPHVELGDDHAQLYSESQWGDWQAPQRHLDSARRFHDELHEVVDPERLIYVAGYDQETLSRVRVERPGEFKFRVTRDGDGSVPHDLGLLEGVATQWIREAHGNLPRSERVLAGIHDLLASGETGQLAVTRPTTRGFGGDPGWLSAEQAGADVSSFEVRATKTKTRLRGAKRPRTTVDSLELEAQLAEGFLAEVTTRDERQGAQVEVQPPAPVELSVEVVCADLTKTRGDFFAVGHYVGVLPSNAERALDRVVSFTREEIASGAELDAERFVLTALTRRGVLRGELGSVNMYPWADSRDRNKMVAIAGMGHPGGFTEGKLRRLARSLAWTVGSLPQAKTISTVLIGSGNGGLEAEKAARGLVAGLGDAIGAGLGGGVKKLRIVEWNLVKARRMHRALQRVLSTDERVSFKLRKRVVVESTGHIPEALGWMMYLKESADVAVGRKGTVAYKAFTTLTGRLPKESASRERARESLAKLAEADEQLLARLTETLDDVLSMDESRSSERPVRISFTVRDGRVRAAAINDSAVVPERVVCDRALAEELARRTREPEPEALPTLGRLLNKRLIPADFRTTIENDAPLVIELERDLAQISWEVLASDARSEESRVCIGLRSAIARQLRTTYSPPPERVPDVATPLRALVIGDPGDPELGDDLPGARREAEVVAEMLRAAGVETVTRIGAPEGRDAEFSASDGPASRLEVLRLLDDEQGFDLLHYSGHGDFDPEDPSRTGWLFKDGVFSAMELASVERMPRLVVANACLSGRLSRVSGRGATAGSRRESGLLPSLVDQFLRQGVHNYVGTAWEVDDLGAELFARTFYRELLSSYRPAPAQRGRRNPARSGRSAELGRALLTARQELAQDFGALWLAYQHYGDPTFRL